MRFATLALLAPVLLLPSEVDAQRSRRRFVSEHSRNHASVRRAFASVTEKARQSTVRVKKEGRVVSLGVIVSADGYIVTQAAVIGPTVECQLATGESFHATRVGVDESQNIALLEIKADKKLPAIEWAENLNITPGSWVISTGTSEVPFAIGIMSTQVHSRRKGFLGVQLSRQSAPARLAVITPDSAAARAGLRVDDVVLRLDATEVDTSEQLSAAIGSHQPGDTVKLRIRRGARELDVEATLGINTEVATNPQERFWGPLSALRTGFSEVIQHDTVLRPEQCGGPLLNLDGKAVGVNVARPGRVESLALTARSVERIIKRLEPRKRRRRM